MGGSGDDIGVRSGMVRPSVFFVVKRRKYVEEQDMSEIALIGICAGLPALVILIPRCVARVRQVPREPMDRPVASKNELLLPTAGVRLPPRSDRPVKSRGGRRELRYRPPVCSRVRHSGPNPLQRGAGSADWKAVRRTSVGLDRASALGSKARALSVPPLICRQR